MGKRLGFDFFFFVGENGKPIMNRVFLRILSDEGQPRIEQGIARRLGVEHFDLGAVRAYATGHGKIVQQSASHPKPQGERGQWKMGSSFIVE